MLKKFCILLVALSGLLVACNESNTQTKSGTDKKIHVAVFNGNGASPVCVLETREALKIDDDIVPSEITAAQIAAGALDTVDVLVFPGGSGSKELNNLGTIGAQKVKEFVQEQGKGIVGICAGGYLLSTTPTYPSLQIIDAKNIDREHYSRGRGLVEIKLTEEGERIFPELKGKRAFLQYYDGPILAAVDSSDIKYVEIGKYVTDIHSNPGTPKGITPGKTVLLYQQVGKGRVFVSGGHPEATQGYRWMVARMARMVSDGKIKKYSGKWYRPDLYSSELMFTPGLKKKEKQLFWKLFDTDAKVKIAAIDTLFYQMHSRPSVRWSIGLLRDSIPAVRAEAARILKDAEYTFALPDLKEAYGKEQDKDVAKVMESAIEYLSQF